MQELIFENAIKLKFFMIPFMNIARPQAMSIMALGNKFPWDKRNTQKK